MISTAHGIENKKSERIRQNDVYCTLCQVLVCVGSLDGHLNGKKHNKTLKNQEKSSKFIGRQEETSQFDDMLNEIKMRKKLHSTNFIITDPIQIDDHLNGKNQQSKLITPFENAKRWLGKIHSKFSF